MCVLVLCVSCVHNTPTKAIRTHARTSYRSCVLLFAVLRSHCSGFQKTHTNTQERTHTHTLARAFGKSIHKHGLRSFPRPKQPHRYSQKAATMPSTRPPYFRYHGTSSLDTRSWLGRAIRPANFSAKDCDDMLIRTARVGISWSVLSFFACFSFVAALFVRIIRVIRALCICARCLPLLFVCVCLFGVSGGRRER